MSFKINVDVKALAAAFGEIKAQVEQDLTRGVQAVAEATLESIENEAQEKLKSSRSTYLNAVDFKELEPGVWVVSLDMEKAGWIEDGIQPHDQRIELLGGNSNKIHTSKDGHKWRVIPFSHNQDNQNMTPKQKNFAEKIEEFLDQRGIPFKGIEVNSKGSPRTGVLHTFNIPSEKPSAVASHPALHGLQIKQKKSKDGNVRREITTFRIISENPDTLEKWQHPGLQAKKFMDKAYAEADAKIDQMVEEVLKRYGK